MRKRDFTADFDEIKAMTNKIRSLNESISFSDDYTNETAFASDEEQPTEVNDGFNMDKDELANGETDLNKVQPQTEDEELAAQAADPTSAVNQIREIALKGMVALCKTPEDPQYEVLKQIFNYCDKANKKKSEEQQQ